MTTPTTFVARRRCGCPIYTFGLTVKHMPLLKRLVARVEANGGSVELVRGGLPAFCAEHRDEPWTAAGS